MKPTNPNPEGLPSLKLPGGYWIDFEAGGVAHLFSPDGDVVLSGWEGGRGHVEDYLAAMNTHTDALGAALEKIEKLNPFNIGDAWEIASGALEAWKGKQHGR